MKNKSKMLFLTAFPPNRKTAGQNYTRNLLSDLANDFDIDVYYWEYPNHEVEKDKNIKSYTAIPKAKSNLSILSSCFFPLFSRRFSFKILRKIKSLANNYDILYFDFSQTFIYSYYLRHPFKMGMAHDIILQKYSRSKFLRLILPWVKWSEKKLISSLTHLFTFSAKDRIILKKEYNRYSNVVPFYIENEIFNIDLNSIEIDEYFVMYGAWNRPENQNSLKWVIKNYKSKFPKLKILGGFLPQDIKEEITLKNNIFYEGFVDNPYIIIAKSRGLIAPLFEGAGVKVKAIESLALGTPILGTSVTFEGLPISDPKILINISDSRSLEEGISYLNGINTDRKIYVQKEFFDKYSKESFKEQVHHLL